jgi:glycerate dehydrogenase
MKITFLDRDTFPHNIKINRPKFDHHWQEFSETSPQQVLERIADTDIVLSNKVVLDRPLLEKALHLKHIAVTATGYNNIDISACEDLGIGVSNVRDYASTTVPEQVIGYLFALRRQLLQYRKRVIEGAWQKSSMFCLFDKPIKDLAGSRLGIIGFGALGQATAKLALGLGIKVAVCSSRSKSVEPELDSAVDYMSLDDLLSSSDAVSIHCTLNKDTENLIDHEKISLMPQGAILINTARGGIVNETAAAQALLNEHLGGIAFDVLTQEPPVDPSPLLEIAHFSNVIITPHIAWASETAMQRLVDEAMLNIEAFVNNNARNLVTNIS